MYGVQSCGLLLPLFRGLHVEITGDHKTAELIEMPFGVGPRNHVLVGGQDRQGKEQFERHVPVVFIKKYTSGEATSRSLWSRYDRHFVGITRYTALS